MMFWIVQTWCVIGILMLLLSLLKRSRKVPPALLHALWVVVLLKSLAPQLVAWPYSLPSWASSQSNAIANLDPSPMIAAVPVPTTVTSTVVNFPVTPSSSEANTVTTPAISAAIEPTNADAGTLQSAKSTSSFAFPTIDWDLVQRVVLCLWIVGSVVVLAIELFRIIKLNHVLRGGQPDVALAIEVDTVAKRLGIATIPHRVVNEVSTPLVWSCGTPVLIWPAALSGLTAEARRGLIAHELAHVKRRDHWIAWLELASKVLWWWNPLQVALRRNLRDAADQACDAYVVNALEVPRRLYAETLLSICEIQSQSTAPLAGLAAMHSNKRVLEIRLRNLMRKARTFKLSKQAILVVAILAVVVLPGWSQQRPERPTTKAETVLKRNVEPIQQEKKRAERNPVLSDVKQEELPAGWPIPWIYVVSPDSSTGFVSVSGAVVDEMKRPVSNAIVTLTFLEFNYGVSKTNSSGEFKMDRIAVPAGQIGSFHLTATHPSLGSGQSSVGHRHAVTLRGSQDPPVREETYTGQIVELVKFRDLQGVVRTPNGDPVADAEVLLTTYDTLPFRRFDTPSQTAPSTKSDNQGRFRLPNAPRVSFDRLEVRHKDWPSLLVKLSEIESPIECKFNEGVRIKGRVEFPKNALNPDGQISVFSTRFGQTLDSSGLFDFKIDRRLVGKTIMLNSYAKSENLGILFDRTPIEVSETGNELVIGMQASRAVSGTVRDQRGKQLSTCTFRWRDVEPNSKRDQIQEVPTLNEEFQEIGIPPQGFNTIGSMDWDGTYHCNIPQKAGVLVVSYSYVRQYLSMQNGMLVPTSRKPYEHEVKIDADISDLKLDIEIPGPPPREFLVKDAQGKPVPNGDLTIAWNESQQRKLSEDLFTSESILQTQTVKVADGKATVELPEQNGWPSNWIGVLVETDSGSFGWTTINDDSESPIDIFVEKPIGWIIGRTTVDKKPVANVPIQQIHYVDRGTSVILPPIKTTSDASGEYRLPNIAPLSGYIVAGIPDGLLREGSALEIRLNPGQSLRVEDFKFLRPHGSIAGRVVTPDGAAVAGVEVYIKRSIQTGVLNDGFYWAKDIAGVLPSALRYIPYSPMNVDGSLGQVCAAVSDADGHFVIPNLPKGSFSLYVMRFSGNGLEMPVQNVAVEVGKQDVKLVCPPPAPLNVWLQSPNGYPAQPVYGVPTQLPPPYLPVQAGSGPRDAVQPLSLPK